MVLEVEGSVLITDLAMVRVADLNIIIVTILSSGKSIDCRESLAANKVSLAKSLNQRLVLNILSKIHVTRIVAKTLLFIPQNIMKSYCKAYTQCRL